MAGKLSDRQLAQAECPVLPGRLSQRRSSTRTVPTAPRSFSDLEEWPNFFQDARRLSDGLDGAVALHSNMESYTEFPLEPAADEIGVRVAIESVMFPRINKLAPKLNIPWKYVQGGSGRSVSYTDTLIMSDDTQPVGNRRDLSMRIYGNGEIKGPWQWDIPRDCTYLECLIDKKKGKAMKEVLQQLFGDMVLDESKYGFISNYNTTVFFRRTQLKVLQFSRAVTVDDAPLEKFLFVLFLAYTERAEKQSLSRLAVQDTPPHGYTVTVPQASVTTRSGRTSRCPSITVMSGNASSKRKHSSTLTDWKVNLFEEHGSLERLGITGAVIGFAKYGNVLEGKVDNTNLAIKTFDFRFEGAEAAYLHEGEIYDMLHSLQGKHIPMLTVAGRIPHTNMYFLGLSYEGVPVLEKSLKGKSGKALAQEILHALQEIHAVGVLHNDLRLSHVLWKGKKGGVKMIDFDSSVSKADKDDLDMEMLQMKEILNMDEGASMYQGRG